MEHVTLTKALFFLGVLAFAGFMGWLAKQLEEKADEPATGYEGEEWN